MQYHSASTVTRIMTSKNGKRGGVELLCWSGVINSVSSLPSLDTFIDRHQKTKERLLENVRNHLAVTSDLLGAKPYVCPH